MAQQHNAALVQGRRMPNKVDAWILGSSIASLAAAVHLISDANVPPSQIHILESQSTPGDGITSIGDPLNGYDHRPGCLPSFNDVCLGKLLALVPSACGSGRTVKEDIEKLHDHEGCQDVPITHILAQEDDGPKRMEIGKLGLGLKDRMKLTMLMLRSEERLTRKRIDQLFNKPFFDSIFWIVFSTIFTFQPWHSAAEFRRCLRRYFHEFRNLNTKKPLDCIQFNQFESIIMPMIQFLQNQGVDFRLCTKVTDIVTHSDRGTETVSAISILRDSFQETLNVRPDDIVIVTLGSVTSGSSSGSNKSPPPLKTMIAEDELDENWSLWLDLGTKYPSFGDPYNFCTRLTESRLETFTVTLKDAEFFDRLVKLTCDKPGIGHLISLKHSNWKISVCIPRQPFFSCQPDNVQILWGYGLCPEREGSFVKKPMLVCSGEEIMAELLWHLGFPLEPILNNSITIPSVMPRRTASLLPRIRGDRPRVILDEMTNLAAIGQFVEIPDETAVSMDYGVRGAQLAVSHLMGLPKQPEEARKRPSFPFLDLWV
ncbi:hypothetical protein N7481_001336 [Penicillium waksmanii]|uniref:uncharacterized protein n=1 Tax=Penicillium waksmanii TaxID=69791 RepID=UPI0025470CF9|nr:uncharacterized protein N7481_001336 [Penicillium waksmanii]KAJ6000927.1 hypothetical protein N7481_001336 [Penicillium waksmanii]